LRVLLRSVFLDDIGEDLYHLYASTGNPNGPVGASMGTAPGVKALIRNLDLLHANRKTDYDFFNRTDPDQVLRETFRTAIASLLAEHGEDMTSWSVAAHPMRWSPYNFRGVPQADEDAEVTLTGYMNRGSENNLFIAKDDGFIAYDVIPPGQSGTVTETGESQHYRDQMSLFRVWRYKPVPFSRAAVESQTERVIQLEYRRQRSAGFTYPAGNPPPPGL
jgi:penicillin amidase